MELSRAINQILWRAPRLTRWVRKAQDVHTRSLKTQIRVVSCDHSVALASDDWIVLCLIRDGIDYLEVFLDHYRQLGARHFYFLDNGSSDGTLERLVQQKDVTTLTCDLPFARYETHFRNYLLETYATNRWALMVDADELFDYPQREKIPMPELLSRLDRQGFDAVLTQMLDLFPESALDQSLIHEKDFRKTHCWYDLSDLRFEPYPRQANQIPSKDLKLIRGGVRNKVFKCGPVLLTKHALLKYSKGMVRTDPHWLHGARLADWSGVLLHYKFVPGFSKRVKDAVKRKNHYQQSSEYRAYWRTLVKTPRVILKRREAIEMKSIGELKDRGLLK